MNLAHHVLEALINCYSNRRSESLSANQLTRFDLCFAFSHGGGFLQREC